MHSRQILEFIVILQLAGALGWPALAAQETNKDNVRQQDGGQELDETLQEINTNQDSRLSRRKCIPILNFASNFANPSGEPNSFNEGDSPATSPMPNGGDKFAGISFQIPDLHMPIAPQGGSVHSAMKLLSAFDSQFGGLDGGIGYDDETVENVISFRQNRLHIHGLNLSMLNVHLYTQSEPKFALGVTIKNTTLTGQFVYNGPTLITTSRLAGQYRMSIENILLTSSSNLTKQLDNRTSASQPELPPGARYNLATNDFRLNISNLGYISIEILDANDPTKPSANYLLRMLQRLLQKTIKRTYYSFESYIRDALELEGRTFLDCELTRFSPILNANSTKQNSTTNQSSQQQQQQQHNDLARIINNEIARSQLARVPLADFEYQRNILGAGATIKFTNGSLSGLDHVRLNDETRIKLQDAHLLINASVGWFDLKPQYNWSLYLGGGGGGSSATLAASAIDKRLDGNTTSATESLPATPRTPSYKGFVAFNLKGIDFDAVISKGLGPHTRILVDELMIRRLDSPKMDIGGLPGMNRIARTVVNFFMGRLKQRVASSVQPALKQQLERSLNRMNVFN